MAGKAAKTSRKQCNLREGCKQAKPLRKGGGKLRLCPHWLKLLFKKHNLEVINTKLELISHWLKLSSKDLA